MNKNKINITYIIDSIGWAGAQTHLISVLTNIDLEKFNVSVVCLRAPGEQFDILEELNITSLVLNLENLMTPIETIKAIFKLHKFLRLNKTDVFQSYMFNPNLIASIMACIPWLRFKLITTRRDTGYWHQQHHWWLYRFMNLVTYKIIAVSSEVRLESIKNEKVSPKKIITIYNGIDLDVYSDKIFDRTKVRKNFGIKENEFVFGMLAALRPEKRHELFIEAASKVIVTVPNAKFMVVGGGYAKTKEGIIESISKYKMKDKFLLTGVLGNVVPALAAFDISILCSDTEGMSNSVLQSIAMSKATIVTNVGGNPEVIEDGVNGVLIPPNDSDSLAESMIELFENNQKRHEMEIQALNIATDKFNIYPIIKMLEAVYTDIVPLS